MLIQLIDDDIRYRIPLEIDDDTRPFPFVGFIVDMRDAFDDLFVDQLTDTIAKGVPVDLVGYFRNDDGLSSAGFGIDMNLAAKNDTTAAKMHGSLDAFHTIDDPACWKVGSLDMHHQLFDSHVLILDIGDTTVDDLRQVMRHHIGGHPNGDTAGTVHQQLGDAGGQNRWLLEGVVEIGLEVDRILLDIFQHILGLTMQTGLNIPHCRRAVTILVPEVTLAVDEQITHAPFLRHTDHGVEDGCVAVGVVLTHDLTNDTRCFLMGFVTVIAQFVHPVEDPAMNRLETVPNIGQGTTDNDRHRIIDIGCHHLFFHIYRDDTIVVLRLQGSDVIFHILF